MATLESLVEKEVIPALVRIASALEVVAGVVDEVYREQVAEEAERVRMVSARDVVRQPPRAPRPRAQL